MINSFKTVGLNTYEVIKNDIICGILPPLKKLKLSELKIKYNTSVSTLREILSRLSGDGFVVSKEQKGFYVSPVCSPTRAELLTGKFFVRSGVNLSLIHISEPTRLRRISYAVFCLKKKKKKKKKIQERREEKEQQ